MRKVITTLLVAPAIAVALASCTGSKQPGQGTSGLGSQFAEASDVFGALEQAGMTCPTPKLVNTAAVCGPVGNTDLTLSVAVYPSPAEAKQQFLAHCSGDTWNLFRDGQNWRGAFSTSQGTIDAGQAQTVAAALKTDLVHGCPQS